MGDYTEAERRIAVLRLDVKKARDKCKASLAHVVMTMVEQIRRDADGYGRGFLREEPAVANALGPDGVAKLRRDLGAAVDAIPGDVNELWSDPAISPWGAADGQRGKALSLNTYSSYSFPQAFEAPYRNSFRTLVALFREHGFKTSKWPGETRSSVPAPSREVYSAIESYVSNVRDFDSAEFHLAQAERELQGTKAADMWDAG